MRLGKNLRGCLFHNEVGRILDVLIKPFMFNIESLEMRHVHQTGNQEKSGDVKYLCLVFTFLSCDLAFQ